MASCLDPDTLQRWVAGTLSDAERASALGHIAACSACRQEVSALAQIATRFGERPAAAARPRIGPWIAVAGGVVAAIAVVVAVVANRAPEPEAAPPPARTGITVEAIQPEPPPVDAARAASSTSAASAAVPPGEDDHGGERRGPRAASSTSAAGAAPSATATVGSATTTPRAARALTTADAERALAACAWSARAASRYIDFGAVEARAGHLVAIAGRRARYVVDADEHAAAGTLAAQPGDLVAICPIEPTPAELPAGWGGVVWRTVGFGPIAAAPWPASHALVHARAIAELMAGPGEWRLPASTELLVPAIATGAVEDDRHDMGGWWLEVPPGTPGAELLGTAPRWVLARFARFVELGTSRPQVVLRALEIHAGLLAP